MWDVKPGDLVVFVGFPEGLTPNPGPTPQIGQVYTVRDACSRPLRRGVYYKGAYIGLEEIPQYHYNIRAFRPVAKPSIEVFRKLLTPTPAKETEDAQ